MTDPAAPPSGWFSLRRMSPCGAGAVLLFCLGAAASGPAFAQSPSQSLGDLPALERTDPNVDPYPFDAYVALRNYFRQALPGGWRAAEPEFNGGGFSVLVFVPDSWRGNPSSALQRYCPQPYSNLWRGGIRWIELKPFYQHAYWAGAMCRPPGG
ncbi:hypothetical protein [Xanthobacter sp.]|uniref:hypothetical protein n=1 Tax=Xanthobacter sp. TaxID=35809 RepID=UPI0025EBF7A3|nr:hypothetical protein [Xanthobacter sp.]